MNDKEIEKQIHDIIEGEIQNNINEYLEKNLKQLMMLIKIKIKKHWQICLGYKLLSKTVLKETSLYKNLYKAIRYSEIF